MLDCQQVKGGNKEGDTPPPATPDSPEDSCQHCQSDDGTPGTSESPVYWGIQLDDDLLETIVNIYPEWFKNCSSSPTGIRCNGMAERNHGHQSINHSLAKAMGTSSTDNKCTTLKTSLSKPSSTSASASNSSSSFSSAPSDSSVNLLTSLRSSPPKCQVDEASLQKTMDRNKESLKVKLMLRRPITQLVEQGILPPLKTPPAFHEQRQKLERAKMGDILKNKIQRRPDRQELIQHNILEDTTVDPSLQDKQRQLKKARLADDLNDRLSHRPGPLELVKGNILQADELFAQAIKEGQILFKRTCEGQTQKHPPPRFIIEEDSGGSEGGVSPPQDANDVSQSSLPSVFENNEICAPTSAPIPFTPQQQQPCSVASAPLSLFLPSMGINKQSSMGGPTTTVIAVTQAASSILMPTPSAVINSAPPQQTIFATSAPSILATQQQQPIVTTVNISPGPAAMGIAVSRDSSSGGSIVGSGKQRKKSKSKAQPKTRTIKFHEYKGPPNAQKNLAANAPNTETSYELLLQQQQLFLQWQLEWQQKYPQIILPAGQKPSPGSLQVCSQSQDQQQQHMLNLATACSNSNSPITSNCTTTTNQLIAPSPQPPQITMHQNIQPQPITIDTNITSPSPKMQAKLEDMKVSDLKVELKRRNLPVSGSKPQLIERLKSRSDFNPSPPISLSLNDCSNVSAVSSIANTPPHSMPLNMGSILLDAVHGGLTPVHPTVTLVENGSQATIVLGPPATPNVDMLADLIETKHSPVSPPSVDFSQLGGGGNSQDSRPSSVVPMDIDNSDNAVDSMDISAIKTESSNSSTALSNEDIVRLQQKRIEELQRQLQRSQMQLHQQQMLQSPPPPPPPPPMPSSPIQTQLLSPQPVTQISLASAQPVQVQAAPAIHRQILHQHLQQKMQQQAGPKPIAAKPANSGGTLSSAAVKASLAAFLHSQQHATPVTTVSQPVTKNNRTPNGIREQKNNSSAASAASTAVVNTTETAKTNRNNVEFVVSRPPPPDYDEATKQLNKQQFAAGVMNHLSGQRISGKKSIKSQAVDDVLEILIKNGELPESAAQDPVTPATPETASKTGNNATNLPPVFPDPITPTNQNDQNLQQYSSSAPTSTTTTITTTIISDSSNNKDTTILNNNGSVEEQITVSVPLNAAPTSTLLGDMQSVTNETLDFDFHLDLDDMEAMDLSSVLAPQENEVAVPKDLHSMNLVGVGLDLNESPCGVEDQQQSSNSLQASDLVGLQEVGVSMDIELSDWLDVMIPTSSSSSCSSTSTLLAPSMNCNSFGGVSSSSSGGISLNNNNNHHHNNNMMHGYTSNHEHDPLLSNLGQQSHDPFDLFAVEDMDFKTPADLSALSWDKVDFATT